MDPRTNAAQPRRHTRRALPARLTPYLALFGGIAGAGALVPSTALAANIRHLSATLSPGAVVPGPGDSDATGTIGLDLNAGKGTLCFDMTFSALHSTVEIVLHQGLPGQNGPARLVIMAATSPVGEHVNGCITTADKALLRDLWKNPAQYYVSVNTNRFKLGALRGQLSK